MTLNDDVRRVTAYLRSRARGQAEAVRLDDLAAALDLSRRAVEEAVRRAACETGRVGTSCENLAGDSGPGARSRGMGAFWIVTIEDWRAALMNLDKRFKPLAERRRALLAQRPRTDSRPVEAARAALERLGDPAAPPLEATGQARLFPSYGKTTDFRRRRPERSEGSGR